MAKLPSTTIKGTVYNYRYIDHGAQFRVYAILTADGRETGRAIKVPLSFEESEHVLSPHLKSLDLTQDEIEHRIHTLLIRKQELPGLLQGMYAKDKRLMYLLGNLQLVPVLAQPDATEPEYFMPLYFTQDYVTPMAEFMHNFRFVQTPPYHITLRDAHQAKHLMQAIVELHYHLWEYGIFELSFKLENIGVINTAQRAIGAILVDAAEHTSDLNAAKAVIREQRWRNCFKPEKTDHLFLPTILHKEYADICSRAFTLEALEKRWGKRSKVIERRAAQRLKLKQLLARGTKKELALWIEQQTLHANLHRGIPQDRVDTMMIPHADLKLLLKDSRISKIPLSDIEQQEQAERTLHESNHESILEIYRHTFPAVPN